MITVKISDFRREVEKYLNKVSEGFETLFIQRGKNSGVVVISLEEYNSWKATDHELSSKAKEKRLDSALAKFEKRQSFMKNMMDE